jgi:DNA-binding CsgD family transcriptional regulator
MEVKKKLAERLRRECAAIRESVPAERVVTEPGGDGHPTSYGGSGGTLTSKSFPFEPVTAGKALDAIELVIDDMADHEATTMTTAVRALIPNAAEQNAVLDRLPAVWPWTDQNLPISTELGMAQFLLPVLRRMRLEIELGTEYTVTTAVSWPNVALGDAVEWIATRMDAIKANGKMYRAYCTGEYSYGEPEKTEKGIILPRAPRVGGRPSMKEVYERSGSPWPVQPATYVLADVWITGPQFAWSYSQARIVESDKKRSAVFMPASRRAHTVAQMIASSPSESSSSWQDMRLVDGEVVLYWNGKKEPLQLHLLSDGAETVDEAVARSLIGHLGPDALRDWIGLHQLVGEQGGTGKFLWLWHEHKERAGYASRIRKSTASEAELAEHARSRLHRLTRAQLWSEGTYVENGVSKIRRIHIGSPSGLIGIEGEILRGDHRTPEALAGQINPALYSREPGAPFTQIPANITELPAAELCVYAMLAYAWRAGDGSASGVAKVSAKTLWQYAGFSRTRWSDRRRWPELRQQTERILTALATKHEIDWAGGGAGPSAMYTVTAPHWWRARVLHRVQPAPLISTADAPRTAAELDAVRTARGLTQRQLAEALQVSLGTVSGWLKKAKSAELRSQPLPIEWVQRLASHRLLKS